MMILTQTFQARFVIIKVLYQNATNIMRLGETPIEAVCAGRADIRCLESMAAF